MILASVVLLCGSAAQGTDGCLLRIEGPGGWTKQLSVPQGSIVKLVVLPGATGDATLTDRYPDNSLHNRSYYIQGYDELSIQASAPGRHVLSLYLAGRVSNTVILEVSAAPPAPAPCVKPLPVIAAPPALIVPVQARPEAVQLSRGVPVGYASIRYYPIGSHIMNDQNGIIVPKYASQYYFGRDFSLGTVDSNYQGTPFLIQYLSDP